MDGGKRGMITKGMGEYMDACMNVVSENVSRFDIKGRWMVARDRGSWKKILGEGDARIKL